MFWEYVLYKLSLVNTLTQGDYVNIVTSFEISADREKVYDCNTCLTQYISRKDFEDITQRTKKIKSCEVLEPKMVNFIEFSNIKIKFFTCIGNFFDASYANLSTMVEYFEKGVLPFGTTFGELPAKFVDISRLIYNLKINKQNEEIEKQNRQAKKYGKK